MDGGRRHVDAVGALVRVTAGHQVAGGVEGDEPVQQQPAGALRVVEEQDLPGPQLRGGDRLGEHHVPRLDPRGHRAAGDDVRGVAHRLGSEGDDDQPGEPGEHQGGGSPGHAEDDAPACPATDGALGAAVRYPTLPAEPGGPLHSCHGQLFCASHVNVAMDWVFWALLSSFTE